MGDGPDGHVVTRCLQAAAAGEPHASERLLEAVYDELRAMARARLARTPPGNTLQATALVHEAYLKLVGSEGGWDGRAHFFGAAASAMRDILVDQARRKGSLKRGGARERVELDAAEPGIEAPVEDLLALDEALRKLEVEDPEKARLVMLRYFAGLTQAEAAGALGISERTADRQWSFAKAWLAREMGGGSGGRA